MIADKRRLTFISYSRIDQEFALKLARELKSAGFLIWLDQLDIPTGARWDDEIEKALRECGIFMAILTPASIASENAKDEFGYAIDHGKRILPILLEDCEVPFRLRRFQYVDFTTMNFVQGVKNAKDLLAKMIKEESVPVPQKESIAKKDATLVRGKEKLTQPSTIKSEESVSHHKKTALSEIERPSKTSSTRRSMRIVTGIFIFVTLALLVSTSLARGTFPFSKQPTITATQTLKPTNTTTPTAVVYTQTPSVQRFFTEEFDNDVLWKSQWTLSEYTHGNPNKFVSTIENGELKLKLADPYLWVYYYFTPMEYTEARLDMEFKNLTSFSDAYVSMICRHNDAGWYEFNIYGGGTYIIRELDSAGREKKSWDGGLQAFNFGEDKSNTVTAICKGKELSIFINNGKTRTIVLGDIDNLSEGQIGIAISAHENLPVDVQINSIQVSAP
jgi:hypothetical protein